MKRVLVHGYFRANLGDDLFFRVLAMRYPNVEFYFPTTRCDYKEKFRDLPNVKIIDFLKIAKVTSRKIYMLPKIYSKLNMKRFDAVVCIGGSLFIDRKNPTPKDRIEAENYSFICDWEYAKKSGVPYFVLGANWGPCYNDYFFDYFSRAFDSLDDLYFRDKVSFGLFSDKTAARCGGDILLGSEVISQIAENAEKKKQIAVSVVDPKEKNGDADREGYFKSIASVCSEYISQGYNIKLISFCKDEGDEEACRQVAKFIADDEHTESVYYHDNWQEVLKVIAQSKLILATRFHAVILGWTLNVPACAIAYSNKTVNMMADCGAQDRYISIEDIKKLSAEIIEKNAVLPENIKEYSGAEIAFERLDLKLAEKL